MTLDRTAAGAQGGASMPGSTDADEQRLQQAITLAQMGHLQAASEHLLELRGRYALGTVPRLSIRLLILESVIWYYRDRTRDSLDRARRALALAAAAQFGDLEAEAAVWLSLYGLNFDRYDLLKSALSTAFGRLDELDEALLARLSLIVADANQFSGRAQVADKWYRFARILSRRAGARPILVAIEYNRIVVMLSRIRLQRFVPSSGHGGRGRNWLVDVLSMQRLHQALQVDSLKELLLLGESLARQSDGDYSGSAEILAEIRSRGAFQMCGLSARQIDLEILWCEVMAGKLPEVSTLTLPTVEQLAGWAADEQVVAVRQLEAICRRLGIGLFQPRIDELHEQAVRNCAALDDDLQAAVGFCEGHVSRIQAMIDASLDRRRSDLGSFD